MMSGQSQPGSQGTLDLLSITLGQAADSFHQQRLVYRVQPSLHRRRYVESGGCQSASTNSPASRDAVRLVKGTMKRSWDTCGALTTTAGLTFALDKSEKGYRTKMTSFLEELAIDIILEVIPKRVE